MNDREQKKAAKEFASFWKDKGYEKGESQQYWTSLLRDVLGVEHPEAFIRFEDQVKLDASNGFIDGYIDSTKVMIEQKSITKDLNKGIRQSDGTILTPFQQAKKYIVELPLSKHPRWVITCNFKEMYVYDMEKPHGDPEIIKLEDLPKEYYRLSFITNDESEHLKREMELSLKAGELVGKIHDRFLEQYNDPLAKRTQNSLNILCVRLVFCLYAEDAGLFNEKDSFTKYITQYEPKDIRRALIDLFKVLDTPVNERADLYLDDELDAFPYVNGGLFANENIVIPKITQEIKDTLVEAGSFDWSEISPTIFGAVFESTLNPETRHAGGMHYTSIENIHKVIDPLFLDGLKEELEEIKKLKQINAIERKVKEFQEKLASLNFLDPACGSGNFLTETYLSLRKLENEALRLKDKQVALFDNPIKVSIHQFYGIEINDFAVTVAKTALWIAESQMLKQTEEIMLIDLDFLPLKSYSNIIEGNALTIDWNNVIKSSDLSYIMGNPPFLGYGLQSKEQKKDILSIYRDKRGNPFKTAGKIDYVSCWYYKASEFIQNSNIKVAFVSTNSITQGEQVASVWKPLFEMFNIHINFAYRTFRWDSEANIKAHVHCVIIGFSTIKNLNCKIYNGDRVEYVDTINPYLMEAPTIFITSRTKPLCKVTPMTTGNRPADGGHLIIEADDYELFVTKEPNAKKYIKSLTGAVEYINNKKRYCLWLVGANPSELTKMPEVMNRIDNCRKDRLNGAPDRQKLANTPMLFRETKNPDSYIIIPATSSEKRKYIPLGFLDGNTIPTNSATIIPNATLFEFGILTSNVHMAWMRIVAGRLKSDYRYSKDIVYNNFPWCEPTEQQKNKIEKTAQLILDARAKYPESSLADMYGEHMYLYPELLKAHQDNDRAVMETYGFTKVVDGKKTWLNESETVAELFKMYQKLTEIK